MTIESCILWKPFVKYSCNKKLELYGGSAVTIMVLW